ncbi:hypothetical protein [Mongoliitalea lutea]|uniref:Cell division protease FtsH n=1 Tax=Mongoliitalea lutea TaxID=849756 RepID=A0A8J3CZT7_9BACT|nr:hypothetical protein [Mongoliitalea lutea]GHB49475.1 hypothetical protein GCM10008106_32740 [Mongoliitalea lutea]
MDLYKRQKELLEKQVILQQAKETLKREFVGIDGVIEEVVDAMSSWYLFPDIQEKPVIINLWGLTGVGKSSLVNRLVQLIGMEQKYFSFDLGETDNRDWNVQRTLEEIYDNVNGYPVILALDEFQNARTLDDLGREKEKSPSRVIWQLLDSGKFKVSKFNLHLDELFEFIQRIRFLISNGVVVKNGMVVENQNYFIQKMHLKDVYMVYGEDEKSSFLRTDEVLFVPSKVYGIIYSFAKDRFSNKIEFEEKLLTFDGYETLSFLLEVFDLANSPKKVDCSKGLIFVMGNLDEAYTMSHNFNPDMDADEFHEQSLKITVPHIKKALQKRFRNEQIARLGNLHIIYPAFSKASFQKIIALELAKIEEKVLHNQGIRMLIDATVHELIYKEAVYPTQGTRPIFTTIHQVIHSKLGRIITEMILNKLNVCCVKVKAKGENIQVEYYQGESVVHIFFLEQPLVLEELRKSKQDDFQAISAVHEAGHAIISTILLRTIPEVVVSTSAEVGTGGFVHTKFKWKYISKKEIINRLALFLGGYVAERLVFGEENLTTGAENDIKKATVFITGMLKEAGMGDVPGTFDAKGVETKYYLHDEANKLNQEAEFWILKAMDLAEKTLVEQKVWLLKMSDFLSDHSQMRKEAILEMTKNHAVNFELNSLIEDGDFLFYRKHLKDQVSGLEINNPPKPVKDAWGMSLNRIYRGGAVEL